MIGRSQLKEKRAGKRRLFAQMQDEYVSLRLMGQLCGLRPVVLSWGEQRAARAITSYSEFVLPFARLLAQTRRSARLLRRRARVGQLDKPERDGGIAALTPSLGERQHDVLLVRPPLLQSLSNRLRPRATSGASPQRVPAMNERPSGMSPMVKDLPAT